MSLKIIRGKTLPIGVDLGTRAVKMAQMRTTNGEVELVARGSADLSRQEKKDLAARLDELACAIRQILKAHPFRGRQAVLSLPAEDTCIQHVKIPKLPAFDVAQAVGRELQGKLPYPSADAVIRHIVVGEVYGGEGESRQEVIAVAAARKTVEAYLAAARRAKLEVAGVNVEPCAIVECFARLFRRATDASRTALFVDMGALSTQVVLAHGGRIAFARNLSRGGDHLDQVVADTLKVPWDQAHALRRGAMTGQMNTEQQQKVYRILQGPVDELVGEMTQCLRYHDSIFRNQSVERAIFLGGQAHDKLLCQTLARQLNLPAQIGDPLLRVRLDEADAVPSDRREPQPAWAVAVGLSLGADKAA